MNETKNRENGNMKAQKITFSKMENDQWGDSGEMHIYIGEQCYGYIEKSTSAVDVGQLTMVWKRTVCEYTVTVWGDDDTDIPERGFEVKDYATARTALAAAKKWARETITDALLRSQVADVDTTDAAKACSDLAKDAVEYLASVEPVASYTIHALPSQQVFVEPDKSLSDLTATVEPEAPKTVKADDMELTGIEKFVSVTCEQRERNEERRFPGYKPGMDIENCAACGRKVNCKSKAVKWIECAGGAWEMIDQRTYKGPGYDDCGGYMGCWPVGSACAKKIPAHFFTGYKEGK